MKIKSMIISNAVLVAFFIIAFPLTSSAQSETVKSAHEEVLKSADKLTEVKNATDLTPEAKKEEELAAKKDALLKVIALSQAETEELTLKIEEFGEIPEEFLPLMGFLTAELQKATTYFEELSKKTNDATDLNSIQLIASELKNWREAYYDPQIKPILEFILVFQNQEILKIADERFEKISQNLSKVKLLQSGTAELLLNESKNALEEADVYFKEALTILSAYIPTEPKEEMKITEINEARGGEEITNPLVPTGDIVSHEIQIAEPISENETEVSEKAPDIRGLIKNSIEKTKTAYKHFIAIAGMIKGE